MSKASLLVLLVPFILGFTDGTKSSAPKPEGQRPQPAVSYRFAAPVRMEAAGKPIDTDVGHAVFRTARTEARSYCSILRMSVAILLNGFRRDSPIPSKHRLNACGALFAFPHLTERRHH